MGNVYKIRNVDQMKICGLYFCNDPVVEYDNFVKVYQMKHNVIR